MEIAYGRPPLPREHGGWAMLLTPPAVALLARGPDWLGLAAVLGWVVAYCLRGPVEVLLGQSPTGRAGMLQAEPAVARFWLLALGALATVLLVPVMWIHPAVVALLLGAAAVLGLVLLLAARGATRSILAGFLATAGLMAGGPLYYVAADGQVGRDGWTLALACLAFFAGSIFRVKTLARERRSASFRLLSVGLHLSAVVGAGAAVMRLGLSTLVPVSLLAPLVWAVYGALRAGNAVSLAVIGKGEQWLTITFGLLLAAALRW
ncbi:MAG TPA: YwiC-like family protein [Symbiobacteriaceae bacterium]|nr:YwiC-like family protein [Symbiobacteriaceae bacterium]